jgi:hypothetical protein
MEDLETGKGKVTEYMVRFCLGPRFWFVLLSSISVNRKECDTTGRGNLDREAFVKGMWRIDEELRKIQMGSRTKAAVRPAKGLASILVR